MTALPTSPCTTCDVELTPYREPDGSCGWRDPEGLTGGPRPGLGDAHERLAAWSDEIRAFKATARTTNNEIDHHHRLILSYSALSNQVEMYGTHHVHRPTPGTEVDVVMAAMRFGGLTLNPPRGITVPGPDRPPWAQPSAWPSPSRFIEQSHPPRRW